MASCRDNQPWKSRRCYGECGFLQTTPLYLRLHRHVHCDSGGCSCGQCRHQGDAAQHARAGVAAQLEARPGAPANVCCSPSCIRCRDLPLERKLELTASWFAIHMSPCAYECRHPQIRLQLRLQLCPRPK